MRHFLGRAFVWDFTHVSYRLKRFEDDIVPVSLAYYVIYVVVSNLIKSKGHIDTVRPGIFF